MSLEKRVAALEAAPGAGDPSFGKPWHQVIVREGQSLADAVRAYGIEKIGEHDNLLIRTLVSPRFDEQGRIVPPPPDSDTGMHRGNWRELGEVRLWGDRLDALVGVATLTNPPHLGLHRLPPAEFDDLVRTVHGQDRDNDCDNNAHDPSPTQIGPACSCFREIST